MTKYKCDICGEEHDRIHIIIECSNCYVKGWEEQWKRDRGEKTSEGSKYIVALTGLILISII